MTTPPICLSKGLRPCLSSRPLAHNVSLALLQHSLHNRPNPSLTPSAHPTLSPRRTASSASSTRWLARQSKDRFARDAKLVQLKSRAAYKLLEIDRKYRIFKPGLTVVDLGFAPGSWSQVAVSRTSPDGRVIGIDIIPAQPPTGASALQGNFLSKEIREELHKFVRDPTRGKGRERSETVGVLGREAERELAEKEKEEEDERHEIEGEDEKDDVQEASDLAAQESPDQDDAESLSRENPEQQTRSSATTTTDMPQTTPPPSPLPEPKSKKAIAKAFWRTRVVDVVISDMSAPWPLGSSTWVKSVSNPYRRMMNTSGNDIRDHTGSMDLCHAALEFCWDNLVHYGDFVCKYYSGSEERAFENRLKAMFHIVHRLKPEASQQSSKEKYFIAQRRKKHAKYDDVFKGRRIGSKREDSWEGLIPDVSVNG